MQHKISKTSIFRFLVQVLFFFILPGLFDLTFTGLKHAYLMILSGKFNFIQLLPDLLEALIIIPATMLFGRFFCGWLCAFGAFNDFIYLISKRVFRTKLRVPEKIDSLLKYLKYVVLVFIISIAWNSGNNFFSRLSPWEAFAQISELPTALFQYTLAFAILLIIVLGAMLVERFFCRYLCPLGAILSIVSKVRPLKIEKHKVNCGTCRLCTNNCSMGIQLYKMNKVTVGECINCFKCIETCPRKNPQATIFNEKINSAFAGAVIITAFAGVYSMGNMAVNSNNVLPDRGSSLSFSPAGNSTLAEPRMNAQVDNNVPQVKSATKNTSTAVKAKAGSSSTSAKKVSPTPVMSNKVTDNKSSSSQSASQNTPAKKSMYKDGTFVGVGYGHRSGLQVSVTISNDQITNVEILSNRETPRFSMYAFNTVPQEILQTQSTNVDAVSGATETSDGIMLAVKDALSQAKA